MADITKKPEEGTPQSNPTAQTNPPQISTVEDDSDPDFDDLDDVLDQFSANAPSQPKPPTEQEISSSTPAASGPGRPSETVEEATSKDAPAIPTGPKPDESENEFMERLSKEMSAMLSTLAADPSKNSTSPEDMAKLGKELEDFTYKMEKEGIQPEDLLKALLGEEEGVKLAEAAREERDRLEKLEKDTSPPPQPSSSTAQPLPSTLTSKPKTQPKSFEDTIRSTMSRLGESDKTATSAVQQSTQKSEEDLLADMLKALDSGPAGQGGEGGDISSMFLEMMQQLTHKDLLYEPMKELHAQYPSWLESHKSKLDPREYERYERQSVIVAEITNKFEEPGFSDDDPKCKEFIWEKMQKMQDEGAPPEELVKNPFPGTEFGGIPGMGGGGDQLPEGLGKELEEGCPTQ